MHDYAILGHDRSVIGRWLGVISITLAGGIAQLFTWLNELTGLEAFSVTITTGLIYWVLDWVFNKWAWKIPILEIPNLNGKWQVTGKTLDEDGNTRYEWNAEIGIEQKWKTILIHLKTKDSQSESYTATLSKQCGLPGWRLSYSYRNNPNIQQSHELNSHKGYCEVELNADVTSGEASYFNSAGRRSFGTMYFTKV
ncbi:pancortin-3 [Methylovulum psychrotolerans]|uniref:Uncharacterized protein n=1 Tax=Methylovulum psychrotolerans TaxID=1704499 RepID=A0A2S5CQK0_9GAMM|nr:pancortin-3 [Methylovulum psychrotolerans]POZ53101.1 hypothetical protein AADEFJLK_00111 [Methylovulum psychrotolerans]